MCGRFGLEMSWGRVAELLGAATVGGAEWSPSLNICPTQRAPILRSGPRGGRELALHRWGLVPAWAKPSEVGARLINARAETAATKPSFRRAFASARCLVPATGYYEWSAERGGGGKRPHWITPARGGLITFAGLWERWRSPDGSVLPSFTILTTAASADIASLHHRMPALIEPEARARWLDPASPRPALEALITPAAPGRWRYLPVSRAINAVGARGPGLIAPVPPGPRNLSLDL